MRLLTAVALITLVTASGCKKKTPASAAPVAQQNGGAMAVAPGPGGGVVAGAPGVAEGGGGGAVQAVRGAVARVVNLEDMKQIHIYIENASGASGRMPSQQETLAALMQEAPKIAELVNDGTIVLHNARTREEVWAYEKKALDQSGWVVTSNGVERMESAALRQRLGR
jgi:hypothetical protein